MWHLGGWTQLQRLRRKMVKPVDASLHSKLKALAELLGIRRAVQLVESALVQVPTVVGWLKPVILLPASALTGLSPEQMEAILAHELAHIKRLDYLVNMLQTVVEILGFYHPAVWWVSHKIRVERENCCDDLAVSVSGDEVRYARALTLLEEIRGGQAALAVAAGGGSLLGRIRRLLCKASQEDSRSGWGVLFCVLLVCICVVLAVAQSGLSFNDASAKAASLEAIRELVARNERLSSLMKMDYRVEFVRSDRSIEQRDTGKIGRPSARRRGRSFAYCEAAWAQDGNRQHSTVAPFYGPNEPAGKSILVINGKVAKKAYKEDLSKGSIDEVSRFDWDLIMPSKLGWRPFEGSCRLSEVLTPECASLRDGRETIDGRESFVVDANRPVESPYFARMRIWIDCERGMPLRLGYYDKPVESGEGRLISDVNSIELHELPNGGWIPVKGVRSVYHRDGPVREIIRVDTESITVEREDIPESLFALEFPKGAIVYDRFLARKLETLGKVLFAYADEHDDMYPERLEEIASYDVNDILPWAMENVTYVGKGKKTTDRPRQTAIAYDQKIIAQIGHTNVLLRDGRRHKRGKAQCGY
ncbi:MAG: M56 family metallopeptidase [Planctomycetota bacterium]